MFNVHILVFYVSGWCQVVWNISNIVWCRQQEWLCWAAGPAPHHDHRLGWMTSSAYLTRQYQLVHCTDQQRNIKLQTYSAQWFFGIGRAIVHCTLYHHCNCLQRTNFKLIIIPDWLIDDILYSLKLNPHNSKDNNIELINSNTQMALVIKWIKWLLK